MMSRNTKLLMVVGALVMGMLMLVKVLSNPTGGLAGLIKYAAVPLLLMCFLSPRVGLVLLSIMGFYGDFYKKLAVYYGTVSLDTVKEVLAVSVAMLGATLGGAALQMIYNRVKPDRTTVAISVATVLLTGFLFASGGGEAMANRIQYAVNSGLYLGLAAVICLYYVDREDALKLCRLHYWLGVPWVLWAIRQYYFDFTELEWTYAATELSPVLYSQMFQTPDVPRPYGFASTSSAFGVIMYLFCFGVWHAMRYARARMGFLLCTVIYGVGLYVSMQRTLLLVPFLVAGTYILFRTRAGTVFFYTSCVTMAIAAVMLSDVALKNLGAMNSAIEGSGGWTNRVVRVATFADRLKGWTRLKRASSYSLIGTRWSSATGGGKEFDDESYSHDSINKILINFGVMGLAAVGAALFLTARFAHRTVLGIRDSMDRDAAVFVLALLAVAGALMLMGGNNLHTVPINLVVVTYLGLAAGTIRRNTLTQEAEESDEEEVPEPSVRPMVLRPYSAERHPLRPSTRWG
ncbi:hypothetical protein DES53_11776 [Roseimicrobium gellanilyticum]|uniref:O-antigen ligase-like membrane protein n=1 Tax=Roseimicrobium gellanilyticum TaxID=748857 RepID=A0A366H4Q0_9BACT|nr:hypothetical protein [Roseimicrobium gellanilyticum]RBP36365.1 hypothetical protein DES53_11776 [Roseimicrobium gellanilyticum]